MPEHSLVSCGGLPVSTRAYTSVFLGFIKSLSRRLSPVPYLIGLVCLVPLALVACSGAVAEQSTLNQGTELSESELIIYSGRDESLLGPIIEEFQTTTGIPVKVKYGSSGAIAATILEEGDRTPADIYYGSDPGSLGAISHLLVKLPQDILNLVPSGYRSIDGKWVGISGRARVVVYNTSQLNEQDLPDSISDFTDPAWKGRIGWAPTNGSFQSMVTAMRVLWGDNETRRWLEGIQANSPKIYPKNTPIVRAVADGEVEVGFVNHYYLYRFLQAEGEAFSARNHHLKDGDPGATMLVAGAGVLATSGNQDPAWTFLQFMLSRPSQQYFASKTFEYPLVDGVVMAMPWVPLSRLEPPELDLSRLADLEGTLKLLRETGVIP